MSTDHKTANVTPEVVLGKRDAGARLLGMDTNHDGKDEDDPFGSEGDQSDGDSDEETVPCDPAEPAEAF